MKTYNIKPEFLSAWGSETTEDTVITEAEAERLAIELGMDLEDLKEQLSFQSDVRWEIKTDSFEFHFGRYEASIPTMSADEVFDTYQSCDTRITSNSIDPTTEASYDTEEEAREAFRRDYSSYGSTRAEKGCTVWLLTGEFAWIEQVWYDDDGEFDQSVILEYSAEGYDAEPETVRETMRDNDENLGRCKPYFSPDGNTIFSVNEGQLAGAMIDGEEVPARDLDKPETIEKIARRVNPYFGDYSGWSTMHIALDGIVREGACRECPWFDECSAMDETNE